MVSFSKPNFPRIDIFFDAAARKRFEEIPNRLSSDHSAYHLLENPESVRVLEKPFIQLDQSLVRQKAITDIGVFIGAKVAPAYLLENENPEHDDMDTNLSNYSFLSLYGGKKPIEWLQYMVSDKEIPWEDLKVNAILNALCGVRDINPMKSIFFVEGEDIPYQIDFGKSSSYQVTDGSIVIGGALERDYNLADQWRGCWSQPVDEFKDFSKRHLEKIDIEDILYYVDRLLELPDLTQLDRQGLAEVATCICHRYQQLTDIDTSYSLQKLLSKHSSLAGFKIKVNTLELS